MKELIKEIKYKSRRSLDKAGLVKWNGECVEKCTHDPALMINSDLTHTLEGDTWSIYTEKELERIVQKGQDKLNKRPQAFGANTLQEANIIIDVCVIHTDANEYGSMQGYIDEPRVISTVHSLNDHLRNKGANYQPDGVDSFINCGMGNIAYVNGDELFGTKYKEEGINYDGQGSNWGAASIIEYIKKNVMNSWQDPTRYLIVTYHRLNSSASIAGFAWVGLPAEHRLAGHFCQSAWMGDRDYYPEGSDPGFLSRKAKTPVHEIGHSFGLWHTFHNTNSCTETNPAIQGDRVEDTPPHMRSNLCGTSIEELPSASHMSYAWSTRRRIFSQGQVDRMRAVIANHYEATFDNPFYDWDNTQPVLPEIISVEQTSVPDRGEEVEFTVRTKNLDTLIVEGSNDEGTTSISKTVEYQNDPPVEEGLIASFKGENFDNQNGWLDIVSNNYATGQGESLSDEDGQGVLFSKTSRGVKFNGLLHDDYTYKIKCKYLEAPSGVTTITVKRVGHVNNQSLLFLFTWKGNKLYWDNTTNSNRIDTGFVPTVGELMDIHISRDHGIWINGNKIADAGNPQLIMNDESLEIGGDDAYNDRGMGGIIYSVDVYDRSINLEK